MERDFYRSAFENKANKVARITLLFWLMKVIATTLGETLGDFISMTLNMGYIAGIGITFAFFAIVLAAQISLRRYVPSVYWLVIIGTTTLGTEISDFLDRTWHLGYTLGSLVLAGCLLLTLLAWHRKYHNLNVYPVTAVPKELFYWTAILFSNSLGTAFGDFLGDDLGLSYLQGAMVTAGVIVLVLLLHYLTKINHNLLFWIAFVFTRPFGATFGDLLTKPHAKGGLDLGTLNASLVAIALMIVLVVIEHRLSRRMPGTTI
ncbi:MAG: hypothetical protein JSS82_12740 [Bacteroidetes bacterium]|nr:hypothetical protein [Bacteroidota bacterium]